MKLKEYRKSKPTMVRLRSYTLCSLPSELLIQFFKFLPLKDLINARQVCSQFKWLIDSTPHLWTTATLVDEWPNNTNIKHFERAADKDNVEALIKLGIACLYNEGYPESFDNDTNVKGQFAADYLCRAERLLKGNDLFLWALIRPPWSRNGTCCKATVFKLLKELAASSQECDKTVLYSIARISIILQEENDTAESGGMSEETKEWFRRAAEAGSHKAILQLWQYNENKHQDTASKLDRIRQLREIVASQGSRMAKMELYQSYATGDFGGLHEWQVAEATRAYIRESRQTDSQNIFNVQSKLNNAMRYILVDWLVEVASMKGYSSHTLHMVINCIDRYLMHQPVTRGSLQLVGITAMVICSRLLEPDIITIREAAWLTDGTYKYEKVVRMMGDILATLNGKIEVPSMWDYLMLYCKLTGADHRLKYLALYISELTLLHLDFGRYPLALQAASVFYLARIIIACDCPWPSKLAEYTGFQSVDLSACTLLVHKKCFSEEPLMDHRNIKLSAVMQRYEEDDFLAVSKTKVLDHATLRAQLYIKEDDDPSVNDKAPSLPGTPTSYGRVVEPFLMSPSRSSRANRVQKEAKQDREDLVTTPTGELSANDAHDVSMLEARNDSFLSLESGYDADMESDDEGESVTNKVPGGACLWEVPSFSNSSGCSSPSTSTATVSSPHQAIRPPPEQSGNPAPVNANTSAIPVATANPDSRGLKGTSCPATVTTETKPKDDASLGKRECPGSAGYSGQSFRFDKNGKLRPRSPRRPLKRLENSRCRRRSKRQHSNRREAGEMNRGENSPIAT